jgi:hypothetical protein
MRCHSVGCGTGPNAIANAIAYAEHRTRSRDAVIRVYDDAGNVIELHEHKGDFTVLKSVLKVWPWII